MSELPSTSVSPEDEGEQDEHDDDEGGRFITIKSEAEIRHAFAHVIYAIQALIEKCPRAAQHELDSIGELVFWEDDSYQGIERYLTQQENRDGRQKLQGQVREEEGIEELQGQEGVQKLQGQEGRQEEEAVAGAPGGDCEHSFRPICITCGFTVEEDSG